MDYKNCVIKSRVKYYRKCAKLSQQKLASLAGCSDTMIQMIEYNKLIPNLRLAYTLSIVLSHALGYTVTITQLFICMSN